MKCEIRHLGFENGKLKRFPKPYFPHHRLMRVCSSHINPLYFVRGIDIFILIFLF